MIDVQTHTLARKREEERMRKRLDENFWCCLSRLFFKGEKREQRKAKSKEREEDGGVKYLFVVIYLNIKHTDNQATR